VATFRRNLLGWYRRHRRPLPWREDPTPYRIWISEIMLQQTQAKTVIPYYNRFLERFPDLESLATASEQEVLELWAGLGYYTRARNLQRGDFPSNLSEILALPGIGRYTAGAICSFAFNQVQPVVDGNIRRVVARLDGIRHSVPDSYFWSRMLSWISKRHPSDFNQAIMELGALVCVPVNPLCCQCPAEKLCKARILGVQAEIPVVRAKKPAHGSQIVILIMIKNSRILLTSVHKPTIIPGRWGFPSSNVLPRESAIEAAASLCRRIFGRAIPMLPCAKIRHSITNHRITAHGFYWSRSIRPPKLIGAKGFRWVTFPECSRLLTSSLFHKILKACRQSQT
jgi:A/G-specific adenine glycosylase